MDISPDSVFPEPRDSLATNGASPGRVCRWCRTVAPGSTPGVPVETAFLRFGSGREWNLGPRRCEAVRPVGAEDEHRCEVLKGLRWVRGQRSLAEFTPKAAR